MERMPRVFKVSRSGYYSYTKGKISKRARENAQLLEAIKTAYEESRGIYGSPRIHATLILQGISCSRHRVAKLMRAHRIVAKMQKRFKVKSKVNAGTILAENRLERNFKVEAPDQVWVSDISQIKTLEGWLYLAVVLDLFSRKVIGMVMADRMTQQLVINAFNQTAGKRDIKGGLVHHSDQGSQHTSLAFQQCLSRYGVLCSMSRKGNCYDNAVVESFFHTLKTELIYNNHYETRQQAKEEIFEYIEIFYNNKRMHSYLGYMAPNEFEKKCCPVKECP
ncbi:hypothetical protein IM40_09520 (plasmid) [Candidatus Paracaedimonas acanthamoebae]|nr:hypothetical protein IM40_09520 [Candidatus Paracaedimonas acanthamoebae]